MGSLLEQLQAREAVARTRVEALRAEVGPAGRTVAAEEELLRQLEITRQTVIEVLAGEENSVDIDPGPHPDLEGGVGAAASRVGMWVSVFGQDKKMGPCCRWPTGTWSRW